ncbi:MAG: polymerase subunit tau [Planctomycetota bacterium]|jgi:DNA polymerase-3 subunit gamma/tau
MPWIVDAVSMAETQGKSTPYQVVARRFRPKAFEEVVGQDAILQSLKRALSSKRVPHAFVFSGSRGVGKTTTARILARCLNCKQGPTPEPCGKCPQCVAILDGSNADVIEIDAATHNGVDDIRAMRERVGFASLGSRYKVYILDEAHMLSKGAWNAFLKTLEEPPPGVVFVLATTELEKIPETIRSRCQVLMFRRVGDSDIVHRLGMIAQREGVTLPEDVLSEIALQSRGGMRDAETTLERVLPVAREAGAAFDLAAYRALVNRVGTDRAIEVALALAAGDAAPGLQFAAELRRSGIDEREALGELVDVLRQALLLHIGGKDTELVVASGSIREQLQRLTAAASTHQVEAMIQAGVLGRQRMRELDDRAVLFDLTMVRMSQAGQLPALADLLAELRAGAPAAVPAARSGAPGTAPGPTAHVQRPTAVVATGAAGDLRSRVLARLQDKPPLQLTVEKCRIDGPDASGRIVVRLQTDMPLHRGRLESPVVQQQLGALLVELSGAAGPVEYQFQTAQHGASRPEGGATPAPVPNRPASAAVQRTMQRFGGRVVAVNPDDAIRPSQPAAERTGESAPESTPDPDNG